MTAADLAATVREALIYARGTRDHAPAVAALDALQAQAETNAGAKHVRETLIAEADAQRERAEAAEAERDRLKKEADRWHQRCANLETERDRLAARVTELEAALREITNEDLTDELAAAEFKRVARAALAGEGQPE